MFVSNFIKILLFNSYNTDKNNRKSKFNVTLRNGTTTSSVGINYYSNEVDQHNTKLLSFNSIILGDSDVEEDYNQINIQGNEISISGMTMSQLYGIEENNGIIFITIKGTPTESYSIKEFGLFKTLYNSGNALSSPIMLYRKVLETPIELVADTAFNITFKIKLPIT